MMRKLFLAVAFVTFLLPAPSMAASEFHSFLPGLDELYAENAPSALDKALKGFLQKKSLSSNIKNLVGVALGLLAAPGMAYAEAERECMSRGIVAGYSRGVAVAVWQAKPLFVRDRMLLKTSPGESNNCRKTNIRFHNAALVRGYVEVSELPLNVRVAMRDFLGAFIHADQSYLPNFRDANGADGFNYEGNTASDRFGSLDFYQTYANEFQRRHALKSN
jgi:hypothetical protein